MTSFFFMLDAGAVNGDLLADSKSRRRRRCCLLCCVAMLLVVAILMTVLALIVLKVKDPNPEPLHPGSVSLSLTLGVAASLENPNYASAKFNAATIGLRYCGREVGVAYGPPGSVGTRSTLDFNLTLDVMFDRMPGSEADLLADVIAGSIVLTTVTVVGVRVKVGFINQHVDAMVSCNVTLSFAVTTLSVAGQTYDSRIW
ncbi:uncharacterized protein LOC122023334 [Zingiber officinale]|uniref:uncharacterized protein LOC122023334 n=1 Tax=Zingiber officinale TaxID=94328 RepID=UPI001C4D40CC|nr:uncharacterized protein LOC122023334 [Zingiber officinale]